MVHPHQAISFSFTALTAHVGPNLHLSRVSDVNTTPVLLYEDSSTPPSLLPFQHLASAVARRSTLVPFFVQQFLLSIVNPPNPLPRDVLFMHGPTFMVMYEHDDTTELETIEIDEVCAASILIPVFS